MFLTSWCGSMNGELCVPLDTFSTAPNSVAKSNGDYFKDNKKRRNSFQSEEQDSISPRLRKILSSSHHIWTARETSKNWWYDKISKLPRNTFQKQCSKWNMWFVVISAIQIHLFLGHCSFFPLTFLNKTLQPSRCWQILRCSRQTFWTSVAMMDKADLLTVTKNFLKSWHFARQTHDC